MLYPKREEALIPLAKYFQISEITSSDRKKKKIILLEERAKWAIFEVSLLRYSRQRNKREDLKEHEYFQLENNF